MNGKGPGTVFRYPVLLCYVPTAAPFLHVEKGGEETLGGGLGGISDPL